MSRTAIACSDAGGPLSKKETMTLFRIAEFSKFSAWLLEHMGLTSPERANAESGKSAGRIRSGPGKKISDGSEFGAAGARAPEPVPPDAISIT
jgi:hypothetical protein